MRKSLATSARGGQLAERCEIHSLLTLVSLPGGANSMTVPPVIKMVVSRVPSGSMVNPAGHCFELPGSIDAQGLRMIITDPWLPAIPVEPPAPPAHALAPGAIA